MERNLMDLLIEKLDTEEMRKEYKRIKTCNTGYRYNEERITNMLHNAIEKEFSSDNATTGNNLIDSLLAEILKNLDTKEIAEEMFKKYKAEMINGRNKNAKLDSNRKLTEEEKNFAAIPKNHNLIYSFMKTNGLDFNEWYDICALGYIDAVKTYMTDNKEALQQYSFSTIAYKKMENALYRELKANKRRMPENGIVSLDYTIDDDRLNSEGSRIEEWWIDRKTSVEKQALTMLLFEEYRKKIAALTFGEDSLAVLKMLLFGYSETEIVREMKKRQDFDCWNRNMIQYEISRLRKLFMEVFGI